MNAAADEPGPHLPLLAEPRDGVGDLIDDRHNFREAARRIADGTGPIAVDVERAQAFRYSARAYLLQLRRCGAGTALIDPLPFDAADWQDLGEVMADAEWIIHAAGQDTPSLAELGLLPRRLFDTELAARLLNKPRVGLSALIEEFFELRLEKEYGMADWSSRPLPRDWLNYAALDVELLIELRDALAEQLRAAGRDVWAEQEFAFLASQAGVVPPPREDPWRHTSGIHLLRTPRQLAILRELWVERDDIARRYDKAPGKVLPDRAITELAGARKVGRSSLRSIEDFRRRPARRFETNWLQALQRAAELPADQLPPRSVRKNRMPPFPRAWERVRPGAYTRWLRARDVVNGRAAELGLPAEVLITPAHWRDVCWAPPAPLDATAVAAQLEHLGARPWQRELLAEPLAEALVD